MINLEKLKERIAERYDPDYILDILQISSEELLEAFEERVWADRHLFEEVDDGA